VNTPRHPAAWIAVVAGLVWLVGLADRGWIAFLLAVLPGALLVTGGVGTYLLPGDIRLQTVAATGGLLGVALSLPFLLGGVWMALWAGVLSAASFVAAGWIALSLEPDYDEVPVHPPTLRYAARAAGDEALLFTMFTNAKRASHDEQRSARTTTNATGVRAPPGRGWRTSSRSRQVSPKTIGSAAHNADVARRMPAHVSGSFTRSAHAAPARAPRATASR